MYKGKEEVSFPFYINKCNFDVFHSKPLFYYLKSQSNTQFIFSINQQYCSYKSGKITLQNLFTLKFI